MKRRSLAIICLIILAVSTTVLFIYYEESKPNNLKWYHQIDCNNNYDTCTHIANECIGNWVIKKDGVYCYSASYP